MSQTQQQATDDQPQRLYDQAHNLSISKHAGNHTNRFAEAVFNEATPDPSTVEYADYRVAEIYNYDSDDTLELLLSYPDGTRQFIGEDETAKQRSNLFSFVIQPEDPYPLVRTTDEALNLLKPSGVDHALVSVPKRQGEWWLLDTDDEPAGSIVKPGVSTRPFGPSPLNNHVPREYGLGVSDSVFLTRFGELAPHLMENTETPADVFRKLWMATRFDNHTHIELLTDVPSFEDVRSLTNGIFVRGTLRHRDNQHYLETIGDDWLRAETHDMDVWTVDDFSFTQPRVWLD